MHYKGVRRPLPEIARELKVDAVVEGTVVRQGDHVRIRAQLINPLTDQHLWTESYERDISDVLSLQGEVAQTIAREIQIQTTSGEQISSSNSRQVKRKAFDDYLQGRYLYWNNHSEEGLNRAIEYFQSAVNEDPSFAPAFAGLADCHNALGSVKIGKLAPAEARARGEEAARRAIAIDAGLAEAHTALGFLKVYQWEWEAAELELKQAIEINPNFAGAYEHYSRYLMAQGRGEEALANVNRALELDPLSLNIRTARGQVLINTRHYEEAIDQFRRVIELDPNHYLAHWFLGNAQVMNGRYDEAIESAAKAVSLSARAPGALGVLAMAYGLGGRKDEARKILNELLELSRRHYVSPQAIVNACIGLGDKDRAFAWMENSYEERSYYLAFLIGGSGRRSTALRPSI
jgi:tetratricopeptide (TPR) repeat protein